MGKKREMLKILLIGYRGQIGWELNTSLQTLGYVTALDLPEIDLAKSEGMREKIRGIKPNLIVNAAAYTLVDRAEEEPELARLINTQAPAVMAEEAEYLRASLVHYSTDYVFDGKKAKAYTEADCPNPLNVYGRTKLEGDKLIQSADIPCLILRTGWVYGGRGKNFLLTILRLAMKNQEIRVVNDQIGCPNWSRMIANVTTHILAQGIGDINGFLISRGGLYNLSAEGQVSWFDFANSILANYMEKERLKTQRLIPVSTDEYPTFAKRPAYSALNTSAIRDAFGIHLPGWENMLKLAMGEILLP